MDRVEREGDKFYSGGPAKEAYHRISGRYIGSIIHAASSILGSLGLECLLWFHLYSFQTNNPNIPTAKMPSGTPTPTPIAVPRCESDVESWGPELEFTVGIVFVAVSVASAIVVLVAFAIAVLVALAIAALVAFAIAALADEMRASSASRPGLNAKPEPSYVKLVAQQLCCGVSAKDSQQNVLLYIPGVPQR